MTPIRVVRLQRVNRLYVLLSSTPYTDLSEGLFASRFHAVTRYTHERNFIYDRKTSRAFSASIFTKCTHAYQHYVQISTEFDPNRIVNVESTGQTSLMSLKYSMAFIEPIYTELTATQYVSAANSSTKLHPK